MDEPLMPDPIILVDPAYERGYAEGIEAGITQAREEIERLREALSAMTELFKATEASAQWALSEVDRLRFKKELETPEDVHVLFADAAAEMELMRYALACVVLYWDEWKDAPEDHPTALSLEEVVDMCRAHLGEKE